MGQSGTWGGQLEMSILANYYKFKPIAYSVMKQLHDQVGDCSFWGSMQHALPLYEADFPSTCRGDKTVSFMGPHVGQRGNNF